MSLINLIVIDGENIHFVQTHYRIVENLFNNGFRELNWFLRINKQKKYLDAGYILLDFNRKLIINGQNAITIKKEGWEVHNVI